MLHLISFAHDAEHQRFKQTATSGETLYLNGSGVLYERLAGRAVSQTGPIISLPAPAPKQ